jgi:hypothetical protein
MNAIASYLPAQTNREHFVAVSLAVKNQSGSLWLADGNEKDLAFQHFAYTDFPIRDITLFACWSGDLGC